MKAFTDQAPRKKYIEAQSCASTYRHATAALTFGVGKLPSATSTDTTESGTTVIVKSAPVAKRPGLGRLREDARSTFVGLLASFFQCNCDEGAVDDVRESARACI